MNAIVNIIMFQAGWFICVFSVSLRLEWIAITSLALLIFSHLYLVKQWKTEAKIILLSGLVGLVVDSIMISSQIFATNQVFITNGIAPLWLIGLWMLFGMTLNHSLAWLKNHLWIASLAGFMFAPLAYLAGDKLGALHLSNNHVDHLSLLIIGLCWMVITPLLVQLTTLFKIQKSLLQNS